MDAGALLESILRTVTAPFRGDALDATIFTAMLALVVGIGFRILQAVVGRLAKGRLSLQSALLVRKAIKYSGYVVVCLIVFNRFGVDITAILGAAGIAGIAIGFAAQTSVSNVISGIFLLAEKSFAPGDVLTVGDITGSVLSIDFLSVKIQTFDNRFIRIPNETIIKSNVVNITRFPIRRLDIPLTVPHSCDLSGTLALLSGIAAANTLVLDNPEPLVVVDKFGPSGIDVMMGVWFAKSDFLALKNSIYADILLRFAQEGVPIAVPRMDVRVEETNSFRIQAPSRSSP